MLRYGEGFVPTSDRDRPPGRGYERNASERPTFIRARSPGLCCDLRGCVRGTARTGTTGPGSDGCGFTTTRPERAGSLPGAPLARSLSLQTGGTLCLQKPTGVYVLYGGRGKSEREAGHFKTLGTGEVVGGTFSRNGQPWTIYRHFTDQMRDMCLTFTSGIDETRRRLTL
jgi:hypothetical protein